MKAKIPLVLIFISLLVVALAVRHTAYRAWNDFSGYQSPYKFSNAGAMASPAIVEHVYIVLVDGLREDQSHEMKFLNELRSRGADISCSVGIPSLSLPGRAVLMTGAWQEINGQLTNFHPHPIAVETLFQSAKKRNLSTALMAGRGVKTMYGSSVDEWSRLSSVDHELGVAYGKLEGQFLVSAEESRRVLAAQHPSLYQMDYTLTDQVAHDFGAASEEYRQAAQSVDRELQKLASLIDFSNSVLVVTSDHGHIDRGGHGGEEPEVLSVPWVMEGKGVKPGVSLLGRQIDFAPTVAALLGIEIPSASQGQILLDALQIDDAGRFSLLEELFQQKKNFNREYLSFVKGIPSDSSVVAPNPPTISSLEEAIGHLDEEANRAKQERLALEPGARFSWVFPILLLPIVMGYVYLRRRWISLGDIAWGVAALPLYWGCYFILLGAARMSYSFSAVNVEERLGAYFGKDMIFAVVALVFSVSLTALWRHRKSDVLGALAGKGFWRGCFSDPLLRHASVVSSLLVYSLLVKVGLTYWRVGLFVRWHVPGLYWGFGEYLDLLQLMIIGFVAWLLPAVIWLGDRIVFQPK